MAVPKDDSSKAFLPPRKAEEWNKNAHSLMKTMHHCLAVLYENLEEFSDSSEDTTLPDGATVADVAETFSKHCDCLNLLLSNPTNWPVKVPMSSVINVLVRCLKVTSADVKVKPSLSELAEVLPSLHKSAHITLSQLIICCGSNVLPQSRVIIDACLKSLAGAKHLKGELKCSTRAGALKVFCLLVAKFGWSRYLQSLSRSLVQELISDICLQTPSKTDSAANITKQKQEVEMIAQRKAKKKKKGKKHKGDSYSDLPLPLVEGKGNNPKPESLSDQATQQALNLSQLIIQRAEYSQIQALVRSVLDTCKILQREGPSDSTPYTSKECRQQLYCTVFACVTVRLGTGTDRKETISHFQATNLALSLLNRASHSETSDIQETCSKFLASVSNTGNMNRPIVRRMMPDEQGTTKDVLELERETDRLAEENGSLWKQLVDAQLELETQRKELKHLAQESALAKSVKSVDRKSSATSGSTQNDQSIHDSTPSPKDNDGNSSEDEDEVNDSASKGKTDTERRGEIVATEEGEKVFTAIDVVPERIAQPVVNSSSKENGCPPTVSFVKGEKKRTLVDNEDEKVNKKRTKTDTSNNATESDDVNAMISDFVDAAPDEN